MDPSNFCDSRDRNHHRSETGSDRPLSHSSRRPIRCQMMASRNTCQDFTYFTRFPHPSIARQSWRHWSEKAHMRTYNCRSCSTVRSSVCTVSHTMKTRLRDTHLRTFLHALASTLIDIITISFSSSSRVSSRSTIHTIVTHRSLQWIWGMGRVAISQGCRI